MSLSNSYETLVGDALLRGQSLTGPTTVYVGLFTADPTDTGDFTSEVSGNAYARQAVTFGTANPDGTFASAADVTFPVATGSWGTITHIALINEDGASDVIMLSGELVDANGTADPKTITTNDQLKIAAGSLTALFS